MDPIELDAAASAQLLGERSRVTILIALSRGVALPAGELARAAGIGAASASAHLGRLTRSGVVEVIPQGRHRYYRLTSSPVPALLEALAVLGPAAQAGERSRVPRELRLARWCYGHLGGRLAVALAEALEARGLVTALDGPCRVTRAGAMWLREVGVVDGDEAVPAVQVCAVDWSERRPHLAGALGRGLARRMVDARHLLPVRGSRGLRLTDRGRTFLRERLGVALDEPGISEGLRG